MNRETPNWGHLRRPVGHRPLSPVWRASDTSIESLLTPLVKGAVYLLELLDPIVEIRVANLADSRIGEVVQRTDLYLRRRASNPDQRRRLHLMMARRNPANHQIMVMLERHLTIVRHPFLNWLYGAVRARTRNSRIWLDLPPDMNAFREYNDVPPQLSFTRSEEARGTAELGRMEIGPGDPFVCFHARGRAYLDTTLPAGSPGHWRYHDYRDGEIESYLPAARHLASHGLFTLRMGHIVERGLGSDDPRVIDYASGYRSDFGDIYLTAHCKFFLGDTSGLHTVAQAFGVPVAAANWIPMMYPLKARRDVLIPKRLWDLNEQRFLTLREIIASGMDSWIRGELYEKRGIEIVDNTPEEILDLATEMNDRLDGTWVGTEEDEALQDRFRNAFPLGHYAYGFPSRIGAMFLRQNAEWLA